MDIHHPNLPPKSHISDRVRGARSLPTPLTADGDAIPVSPKNFSIFDVLQELRDAMATADGKVPWIAALFRIERKTGKLNADFEYEHIERWAITPAKVKIRAREFAPA
jgi:hypothetical protein